MIKNKIENKYEKFFLIVFTFMMQINFAQNTFPSSGNVGLGNVNPCQLLSVEGTHQNSRILLHSLGGGVDERQADLMLWASEPGTSYSGVGIGNNIHNFKFGVTDITLLNSARGGSYIRLLDNSMLFNVVSSSGLDKQAISINTEGNVGIGTTTPVSKLSIEGSLTLNGGLSNALARPIISTGNLLNGEIRGFSSSGNNYDDGFLRLSAGGGTNASVKSYIDLSGYSTVPDMNGNIVFGTYGSERLRIDRNGYVGIGVSNPTNKLDVNGIIHSKEVKVDMNGWSDFVFKEEYNLPTLEEVEKHIAEKGHLQNIPSEEEVLKNGISLGEMNAKLLQKIEELTLYAIEQEKKNNKQSLRIEVLEKENQSFKNVLERLSKIEEKLK